MSNPATVADVEARWRSLSDDETVVASARLDDAWNLLLFLRPSLETWITDTLIGVGVVRWIVSEAVIRALQNTGSQAGYTRETKTVDDFTRSWESGTRNQGASGVYFTDDELAWLTPGGNSNAFTIELVAAPGYATSSTYPWDSPL